MVAMGFAEGEDIACREPCMRKLTLRTGKTRKQVFTCFCNKERQKEREERERERHTRAPHCGKWCDDRSLFGEETTIGNRKREKRGRISQGDFPK